MTRPHRPHARRVHAIAIAVRTLGVLGALGATAVGAAAQETALTGVVRALDDTPLIGAHVTLRSRARAIVGAPRTATTRDGGGFRFDSVAAGWAELVVRRVGFRPETLAVELPQLPGGGLVVPLERVSQVLRPVVVRASVARGPLAAFERRRAAGFGHFVTHADIERKRPQRTSDLLRTIPGVTLENGESGTPMPRFRNASKGISAARCEPIYWLDGTPLGPALDLDALNPLSIEGIELYSGIATVPPALRGIGAAGTCGVIAIWTRHGARPTRARSTVDPAALVDLAVASGRAFTAEQVDSPVTLLSTSDPTPAYPAALRTAHVRGQVIAEFVVTEQGEIDDETLGIVAASHPEFADAVRTALPGTRFAPATRGGRDVRQVVHLPVTFDPEFGPRVSSPVSGRPPAGRDARTPEQDPPRAATPR